MAERKNLRIVLEGDLKSRWEGLLARKKISQQAAVMALVELVLRQENDVIASMLLGQTQSSPELLRQALEQMSKPRPTKNVGEIRHANSR